MSSVFNLRSICEICGKTFLLLIVAFMFCFKAEARNFFSPQSNNLSWSSVPVCISHPGNDRKVKQFEMVEFGFELPAHIQEKFADPKQLNPFDPELLNIVAVFTKGSKSDTVYGFYYRDYLRDPATIKPVYENGPAAKWNEEPTQYPFRVRYATGEIGTWSVRIQVRVKDPVVTAYIHGMYQIDPMEFQVVSSDKSGFLELSSDRLHFRESGKLKSFFLLGQNIAWTDGTRFQGAQHPERPNHFAGGYLDTYDWIENLARSGGNAVRVVNVPWSYEFEWDTVSVYDMERAWELDQLFSICEDNGVKVVWCMEHGTYTIPPWDEFHLTWIKHPYNRFIPGVDYTDDLLTDSLARSTYKNKLRYFFSRWGYSNSLGIFQLLSEMDYWTFRNPADLENNKEAQRKMLAWHNEMLAYAKSLVHYRPLLMSTSFGDAPRDFKINAYSSPYVDVVSPRHCYFTQRNDNLKRWKEVNGLSIAEPGVHDLWPGKPAIFDEMGMGTLGADPGDMDASSDVIMHNSMWATAFSGTAGAGFYWWSWSSNAYRENNFPALRTFFQNVDMNGMNRPGHWEDANRTSKVSIETFYATDQSREHCAGWVHNASYWWGNIAPEFRDRNGKRTEINSRTGDDANISAPTELPDGTKFQVRDLNNGQYYSLAWFNTRGAGGQSGYDEFRTNIFGNTKIEWRPHEADWGYQLVRLEKPNILITSIELPADTVVAGEVIPVFGNHPADKEGTFEYKWDFGNGVVSGEKNTQVTYQDGTYDVKLQCTDLRGTTYAMSQTIVATGVMLKCAFVTSVVGFVTSSVDIVSSSADIVSSSAVENSTRAEGNVVEKSTLAEKSKCEYSANAVESRWICRHMARWNN